MSAELKSSRESNLIDGICSFQLQGDKKVKELLQELVELVKCDYISDLHGYKDFYIITNHLLSDKCAGRDFAEMAKTVQYVYETQQEFTNREEINRFLQSQKK